MSKIILDKSELMCRIGDMSLGENHFYILENDVKEKLFVYNEINEIMNKKAKHKHLFTRKDINGKTICFSCEKIKYTREKK